MPASYYERTLIGLKYNLNVAPVQWQRNVPHKRVDTSFTALDRLNTHVAASRSSSHATISV